MERFLVRRARAGVGDGEAEAGERHGMVRVGRYDFKNRRCPTTVGYTNILIHVNDRLSPYIMRDADGALMENIWQFSKVYDVVSPQRQTVHRWTKEQGWVWPSQVHYSKSTGVLSPAWWKWHDVGTHFHHAVRYPNGFAGRARCQFVLSPECVARRGETLRECPAAQIGEQKDEQHTEQQGEQKCEGDPACGERDRRAAAATGSAIKVGVADRLELSAGRLRVYYATYARLARADPFYAELRGRLASGENLQIVEVDGPPLGVTIAPFDQVLNGSIHVDRHVAGAWLKGPYSFGHGICLAVALLDGDEWLEEALQGV